MVRRSVALCNEITNFERRSNDMDGMEGKELLNAWTPILEPDGDIVRVTVYEPDDVATLEKHKVKIRDMSSKKKEGEMTDKEKQEKQLKKAIRTLKSSSAALEELAKAQESSVMTLISESVSEAAEMLSEAVFEM